MTVSSGSSPRSVLCVDVGSTFTKAALVDPGGEVRTAATPTTHTTDVLDGVHLLARLLGAGPKTPTLACSSAGGGLRIAVVGYERQVTAEAGRRVALNAGGKVVHVTSGALAPKGVAALRAARPDIVLLVGGTDGGNSDVLLHNAVRLARARVAMPVVVAGNREAGGEVADVLQSTGRRYALTDNVLPAIGEVAPEGARAAIREAFLRHVIGGKGLSRGRAFADLVRAPTPDAVLAGVEVLASATHQDVLVVDVGGATTDVYSVVAPEPGAERSRGEVVGPLPATRTVEADLGVRWNAEGVVEAARREGLTTSTGLAPYAASLTSRPDHLPADAGERDLDLEIARLAATAAVRRHGRSPGPGRPPRDLSRVGLVLGSGGVLRYADPGPAAGVLAAVTTDYGGGWPVPRAPRSGIDEAYLLFVVGLLAGDMPELAAQLALRLADATVGVAG